MCVAAYLDIVQASDDISPLPQMCNIPNLSARLDLLLTMRELPICMEDLTPVRLALQAPHMHLSVMFVSACLCFSCLPSLFFSELCWIAYWWGTFRTSCQYRMHLFQEGRLFLDAFIITFKLQWAACVCVCVCVFVCVGVCVCVW